MSAGPSNSQSERHMIQTDASSTALGAATVLDHLDLIENLNRLTIKDSVEATAEQGIDLNSTLLDLVRKKSVPKVSVSTASTQSETELVYYHTSTYAKAYHRSLSCPYLKKASLRNGEVKTEHMYIVLDRCHRTPCSWCAQDVRQTRLSRYHPDSASSA